MHDESALEALRLVADIEASKARAAAATARTAEAHRDLNRDTIAETQRTDLQAAMAGIAMRGAFHRAALQEASAALIERRRRDRGATP